MAQMLILNPSKRGKRKKKPSAAQLAARAKFAAAAKARASAKRNPSKKRRKAKAKRRAKTVVKLNPSAPMKARKSPRRRRSPLRHFSRKARRNPIVPRGFMDSHFKPAALGATGALLNDIAVGFVIGKLPAVLQKQELRHIVKGAAAVGLAALASKGKIASAPMVKQMTVGALTCVLHDATRAQVQKFVPGIAMGEYLSEVVGPWQGYSGVGMGEYLSQLPGANYPDDYSNAGSYADALTQ